MGDFAALEVRVSNEFGLFLDWGLPKDLFVPSRNLRSNLEPGDIAVVRIVTDYEGTGVIGTCKFDGEFETDTSALVFNQKVELLVYGFSRLGARVIVDNKFSGMLYKNEIFEKLRIGDIHTGFIKKIREDGLIDAALQPQGFLAASKDAKKVILDELESSGGYLPLHDKSSAEEIKNKLCMSKKIFKKTIGGLYKEKKITIEPGGIRLI
jgi:predicted RNA-binding protein (virulence factor B family)